MRTVRAPGQPLESLPSAISKTPIATHALARWDWAVGRTLAEVNLRADTGALVIAVQQGGRYTTSPPADLMLASGDVLYLLGDDSDIMLARRRLSGDGGARSSELQRGKQERRGEPQPPVGPAGGMRHGGSGRRQEAHRTLPEQRHLAEREQQVRSSTARRRLPSCAAASICAPTARPSPQVVVGERLQVHLVDVRAIVGAVHRPDLIPERPDRPLARLHERHDGGAEAELLGAELLVRSRSESGCAGPDAPDHLAGLRRRDKDASSSCRPCPVRRWLPLSVGCEPQGMMTRRMTFQSFVRPKGATGWMLSVRAGRLAIADAEIPVALKGNADQAGDGILRLLRQLVGTLRQELAWTRPAAGTRWRGR